MPRRPLSLEQLEEGILAGDRALLARAITLVESTRTDDQVEAQRLLQALLPHTGGAHRIGVSGVPGVGKSTFIDVFGTHLTGLGRRVAVLAVDPSSIVTGGSILGDKTRMQSLARDPAAFIRPSPTAGTLGGVARRTREILLLCEAAGFDVVLVETVGVGQSETMVAQLVDVFLMMVLPNAGDELQGIKRGILEVADVLLINKADGEHQASARMTRQQLLSALRLLRDAHAPWHPPVLTCSARERVGLAEVWSTLCEHRRGQMERGELEARRQHQRVAWFWSAIEQDLLETFRRQPDVAARLPELERDVFAGRVSPTAAAHAVLALFLGRPMP